MKTAAVGLAHVNSTPYYPHWRITGEKFELLIAQNGSVTIDGKATTARKLRDGDIIEIDGLLYQYLRGNRR